MRRNAIAAVSVLLVLAATASNALAYPSNVTNGYTIGTVYGTCTVNVTARAEANPAVIGQLTGTESVQCGSLSITPYRVDLSGAFVGTTPVVPSLPNSAETDRTCEWQKSCYWSRSRRWVVPGDYYVTHDVDIDVAPYAVGQTYTSVPAGCRVATSDRGHLVCFFKQWVTTPTASP